MFLLSYAQAHEYLNVIYSEDYDRYNTKARTSMTMYALKQGAQKTTTLTTEEGYVGGTWWLRSPGQGKDQAAVVTGEGSLASVSAAEEGICVLPAIWVSLDYNLF